MKLIRTFHPVGQGAFYTEVFKRDDINDIVIVYDCGTMSSRKSFKKIGGKELKDQISDFANSISGAKETAYLFISHLHNDHISGIPDLVTQLRPKTVVLPMLPLEVIHTSRIANFLALGIKKATQIDNLIKDLYLSDGSDNHYNFEKIIGVRPEYNGNSNLALYPNKAEKFEENSCSLSIDDNVFWRYRPFNSIDLTDERAKRLITNLRTNIPGLFNGDTLDVNVLVKQLDSVRKEYKRVMKNANDNLYTLVVESEPCNYEIASEDGSPAGCVYYGDFVPNDNWQRFLNVINDYSSIVGVIQVPHHGAKANWLSEMIKDTHIRHCIISAGQNNRYHHPSYWVINDIQTAGRNVHVVYEEPRSIMSMQVNIK